MKKNKGFTLVELLAVIVVLSLLLTIAVPNVIALSQRIKRNMYCTKVDNIESAAKMYGNDNLDGFTKKSDGTEELRIKVYTLIENNVFKKENKDCDKSRTASNPNSNCVKDPRNDTSMDNDVIVLTRQDKKVVAKYQHKNSDDETYCKNR